MALNFLKHGSNDTRGPHYGAIARQWPNQMRFVIEHREGRWNIDVYRHVPGKGFVVIAGDYAGTLKAAKAKCEEWANPTPVDRNSSAYTDA